MDEHAAPTISSKTRQYVADERRCVDGMELLMSCRRREGENWIAGTARGQREAQTRSSFARAWSVFPRSSSHPSPAFRPPSVPRPSFTVVGTYRMRASGGVCNVLVLLFRQRPPRVLATSLRSALRARRPGRSTNDVLKNRHRLQSSSRALEVAGPEIARSGTSLGGGSVACFSRACG